MAPVLTKHNSRCTVLLDSMNKSFSDYPFFPVHNLLSFIERSTQIHSQSDPISPINALNRGFFGGSWLEYNLKTSNYGDVAGDVVLFD